MPAELISVTEAQELISKHTELLSPVRISLMEAAGHVLSEDIYSKTDVPPFNQSSMDGYAFNFEGWKRFGNLTISGEVAAGSPANKNLDPQNAVRIFTGAPVPDGADTVVMQEKIKLNGNSLLIQDENLSRGNNFRAKGCEIKSGELALAKGTTLSPAAIGYLASAGVYEVIVYPKAAVSVILTGDELQNPGKVLAHGQVYESNSFALKAALRQCGVTKIHFLSSKDSLEALTGIIAQALNKSDIVLLTGGVSVGDYDFVVRAAAVNGVEQIFHKIRQKPGKPLYFGKKGKQLVFGLPGNPASVLTCFYEYVLPALGQMIGRDKSLARTKAKLKASLEKPTGLTQFLKGHYDGLYVRDLKAQESFRLSSFATANCLIKLEEGTSEFYENEVVEIHLLPEYYG